MEEIEQSEATAGPNGKSSMPRIALWVAPWVAMLVLGTFVGAGVMVVFDAAYWAIGFVWSFTSDAANIPLFPAVACTFFGCCIALVVRRYGKPVKPMKAMMQEKGEGESEGAAFTDTALRKGRPLAVRLADFFLPLAGGGPVGVAMGLVGFITCGCSWVVRLVRRICLHLGLILPQGALAQRQKVILYFTGIIGGFAGAGVVTSTIGLGMAIPRVDAAILSLPSLLTGVAFGLLGWVAGLLYLLCSRAARCLWERAGKRRFLLPVACGLVLGLLMTFLPQAGLPGSDPISAQYLSCWREVQPAALVATGIVRVVLIAFLLNMGWSGGPFLPLVYAALCLGLGLSCVMGLDPGTCAAGAATGMLVAFSGTPIMAAAALMCCPVESIPVILVAALATALSPRPNGLNGDFAMKGREKKLRRVEWPSSDALPEKRMVFGCGNAGDGALRGPQFVAVPEPKFVDEHLRARIDARSSGS